MKRHWYVPMKQRLTALYKSVYYYYYYLVLEAGSVRLGHILRHEKRKNDGQGYSKEEKGRVIARYNGRKELQ